MKYLSLDVETANNEHHDICSIGVILVENKKIIEKHYTLINPESYFSEYNTNNIHGIKQEDVDGEPTFEEFWEDNKNLIIDNIIVGHNVKSCDLIAIGKNLKKYNIAVPIFQYLDTLNISKKIPRELLGLPKEDYTLKYIAKHVLGYTFKAHNALEDAKATHLLFDHLYENFYEDFLFEPNLYNYEEKEKKIKNKSSKNKPSKINHHSKEKIEYQLDGTININDIKTDNPPLKNKTFCLSGNFNFGSKEKIENKLEKFGAKSNKNVTKNLDYLIIGCLENDQWKCENGGTKLLKAIEYRKKSYKLKIIKEKI